MKKIIAATAVMLLLCGQARALEPLTEEDVPVSAPCAVLMEQSTGTVLYEKQSHERRAPASVTKVMTMLLVTEALDDGRLHPDEMVTASDRAASMGGSQIWLEAGERMSVSEMLKCVAVVSANDCAVALAEHLCGSEEAFVRRMNERAAELGLADTHFTNCTGLMDDESHYTSAYDIAVMSRELMRHDSIKEYTTIWMDTIRDGAFGLSSTNKLLRSLDGATGLKTGFTSKAMYCLSATAEREGTGYIAVVLGADSSAERFTSAADLLNCAFASYELAPLHPGTALPPVAVELGQTDSIQPVYDGGDYILTERGAAENLSYETELPDHVTAPVEEGQRLGTLTVYRDGETIATVDILSPEYVERLSPGDIYHRFLYALVGAEM